MRFERYDRIVEHYALMWPHLVPGYVPIMSAMLDVVRVRDRKPSTVVDVGCGTGTAIAAIAPACNQDGTVTLVDGSTSMLEVAKRLVGDHTRMAVVGDFTQQEVISKVFLPDTYDLVVCSFALHHLEDADKRLVIEHLARSMQSDALLLLADEVVADRPHGWDVTARIRARFIEGNLKDGRISPTFWQLETSIPTELRLPFRPARIDDLTSWMARAGLAVSCPVSLFGSALMVGIKPPPA